jgi:hypothetical protein
MIARCPFCKSIWVCWNWIHAWSGDKKKYAEANPHCDPKDLKMWCHECHDCGDSMGGSCHETHEKVRNGVPHWLLTLRAKIKYWKK